MCGRPRDLSANLDLAVFVDSLFMLVCVFRLKLNGDADSHLRRSGVVFVQIENKM